MHASVRQYKLNVTHLDAGLLSKIQNEFVPILRNIPGFHAFRIIDSGANEIATISFFETEEGSEASSEKAAAWFVANLAHLVAESMTAMSGEQVLSDLA